MSAALDRYLPENEMNNKNHYERQKNLEIEIGLYDYYERQKWQRKWETTERRSCKWVNLVKWEFLCNCLISCGWQTANILTLAYSFQYSAESPVQPQIRRLVALVSWRCHPNLTPCYRTVGSMVYNPNQSDRIVFLQFELESVNCKNLKKCFYFQWNFHFHFMLFV